MQKMGHGGKREESDIFTPRGAQLPSLKTTALHACVPASSLGAGSAGMGRWALGSLNLESPLQRGCAFASAGHLIGSSFTPIS